MSKKSKRRNIQKAKDNVGNAITKKTSFLHRALNSLINISNHNGIKWFSIAIFLISVFAYYVDSGDYDIWFHLKYGEHYVKNLTWNIDHSVFSWTPTDTNWKYVTWIGSSILYIVYKIASVPGLYIVQWVVFFNIFGIYYYYIKSIGETIDINNITGLMLVAGTLAPTVSIIKPDLFTILFFTIAVFIYFYSKSASKNLFFLYPFVFLIWVNTHGGFIIGLSFITLVMCGELFNYFFIKKDIMHKGLLKILVITVVITYIAIMFNPHGIYYHLELLKNLFSKEYTGYSTKLYAYTDLWQVLFPKIHAYRPMVSAWSMLIMLGLFFVVTVYCYKKNKHLDITLITTNLVFFYFGMNTSRASIFFPLIWFFSFIYMLKKADAFKIKKKFTPLALLLFLFWAGIFINYYVFYSSESWFSLNIDEFFPVKEVEFIKNNKLPGPIFNDYSSGGYMIWSMYPDYKVFIDPRFGPYVKRVLPDWLALKDINNLTPEELKRFSSKYPFKIALINLEEIHIILWLLKSPEWRLAYFDKVAVVIVHKSLFDSFAPRVLAIDLGPKKFETVANPQVLVQLFNLLINININYAREILSIYKQNVSNFYYLKEETILAMEQILYSKEFKLRQMLLQQQSIQKVK